MPKEKGLEWDYVTVPGPEDDAEGESKGVKYVCKHKLWLYSTAPAQAHPGPAAVGRVQLWMEVNWCLGMHSIFCNKSFRLVPEILVLSHSAHVVLCYWVVVSLRAFENACGQKSA
eukprot:1161244-Pelagomonas_calceolata.AAC.13